MHKPTYQYGQPQPTRSVRTMALVAGFIVVATMLSAIIGDWQGANAALRTSKLEYVESVCNMAHNQVDGASEQACGDAQDRTNSEFLCKPDNSSCWAELKD